MLLPLNLSAACCCSAPAQARVLVPVPDRNKPHKVPLQFASLKQAEAWLHSAEGKDMVAEILEEARRGK